MDNDDNGLLTANSQRSYYKAREDWAVSILSFLFQCFNFGVFLESYRGVGSSSSGDFCFLLVLVSSF